VYIPSVVRMIDGGGGSRVVYDTLPRIINWSIRVQGWNRLVIERELYFNFADFFEIESFKFHSATLTITISDVGFWLVNPFSIPDRLTIMWNGYILYDGSSFKGSKTFNIEPKWIEKENWVRIEYDAGTGNWGWLQVSNVKFEAKVSYFEIDRDRVIEANEGSLKKNKEYLSGVINNPSPNTQITPTGSDWVTGFLQFAQMMPQLLLFLIIMFIFIEIIRIFRR
jgi:hypothetical protein